MRRVYRAHEILDISVDAHGDEMSVDWSFRFRDTAPELSPVSFVFKIIFISLLRWWCWVVNAFRQSERGVKRVVFSVLELAICTFAGKSSLHSPKPSILLRIGSPSNQNTTTV